MSTSPTLTSLRWLLRVEAAVHALHQLGFSCVKKEGEEVRTLLLGVDKEVSGLGRPSLGVAPHDIETSGLCCLTETY